MPPNPQRRSQHSHAAILDATIDQLASVGYARLTIERVAATAGVGKATVYRWWPTKVRLVVEAITSHCDIAPAESTGELRSDIQTLVQRCIELITKTPFGQALPQLAADFEDDPQARTDLVAWLGPTRASHLALLYAAAGRADLPHDVDAPFLLDLIAGIVMYRSMLGQHPDEHLVEQLTDFIVGRELPRAVGVHDRLV